MLSLMRPRPRTYAVPEGMRVYAVGDVHGRLDLFEALLDMLREDHLGRSFAEAYLVLLGDYIDRGPHSAQMLDRLAAGPPVWARWTTLRGNHEQTMLDVLERREGAERTLEMWLANGGDTALTSYGMAPSLVYGGDAAAILAEVGRVVPGRHLALITGMPLKADIGDYVFVHAGIRPGKPVEKQQQADMLWIRDEFLGSRADHGVMVVHGHSITAEVDERANRIGIDTGAYATGRLSALVLEGSERRVIATGA